MSRQVTHVRKDFAGDIMAIGSKSVWEHSLTTAISNIETGAETYWVSVNGQRASVYVASNGYRKYLKTTADSTTRNNLDSLPPL
jgi:hypothetical protein